MRLLAFKQHLDKGANYDNCDDDDYVEVRMFMLLVLVVMMMSRDIDQSWHRLDCPLLLLPGIIKL